MTLLPGTPKATAAIDAAAPVEFYFTIDNSPVTPRRQVVSTARCAACHADLSFVHRGTRPRPRSAYSATARRWRMGPPSRVSTSRGRSTAIHRGESLDKPYVLGTTNYQEVRFPGDLRDCSTCHLPGTYLVEKVGATTMVASPGSYTATTPPIAAACQGCHDDIRPPLHTPWRIPPCSAKAARRATARTSSSRSIAFTSVSSSVLSRQSLRRGWRLFFARRNYAEGVTPDPGLCATCRHAQAITSDRGSSFLRCALSNVDPGFPKYPRLPVIECAGWTPKSPYDRLQ